MSKRVVIDKLMMRLLGCHGIANSLSTALLFGQSDKLSEVLASGRWDTDMSALSTVLFGIHAVATDVARSGQLVVGAVRTVI